MSAGGELERIAERLRELAGRLSAEGISDEEAETLAREAAELAAEGGTALDAQLRELGARDPADGGI